MSKTQAIHCLLFRSLNEAAAKVGPARSPMWQQKAKCLGWHLLTARHVRETLSHRQSNSDSNQTLCYEICHAKQWLHPLCPNSCSNLRCVTLLD